MPQVRQQSQARSAVSERHPSEQPRGVLWSERSGGLTLAHPTTAKITNLIVGWLPLSAEGPAPSEILVSQGPIAKPPSRLPIEVGCLGLRNSAPRATRAGPRGALKGVRIAGAGVPERFVWAIDGERPRSTCTRVGSDCEPAAEDATMDPLGQRRCESNGAFA